MAPSARTEGSKAFQGLIRALLAQPKPISASLLLEAFLSDVAQGKAARRQVVAVMAALSARPWDSRHATVLVNEIERTAVLDRGIGSEIAKMRPINIVGTGGGQPSFNISTASAILAAAAGVRILKSGSVAYSSNAGAVDFLQEAKVPLSNTDTLVRENLARYGIAFYMPGDFSPLLKRIALSVLPHSFKDFAPVLNRVGPILELFPTHCRLIGVSDATHFTFYEKVFSRLERLPVWLVNADAGLDEACSFGSTRVLRLALTDKSEVLLNGEELGFGPGNLRKIAGGTAKKNVALVSRIFEGTGPEVATDCVVLNAALLIQLALQAPTLHEAIEQAREAIHSGAAADLFMRLRSNAQPRREAV